MVISNVVLVSAIGAKSSTSAILLASDAIGHACGANSAGLNVSQVMLRVTLDAGRNGDITEAVHAVGVDIITGDALAARIVRGVEAAEGNSG